jgi:predicted ArsR family transcriptional regulator
VREHEGALDAVELASRIGLHVTTVRFHLDALCDEKLIARTRINRPGRGRPRTGYLAREQGLDYRILAEVLAMELGQSDEIRARRAQQAGKKWAARMPASPKPDTGAVVSSFEEKADDTLDRAAAHAIDVFTQMGFAPELEAAAEPTSAKSADRSPTAGLQRVIRLHACPVRDFARSHPEVGCGVHLGLLRGLLAKSAAQDGRRPAASPVVSAQLEPFVEPELCLAKLVAE